MKNLFAQFVGLMIYVSTFTNLSYAQEAKAEKPKQFIYVLHLVPRLHDDKAWTVEDKAAVDRHLANFKAAVQSGQLILAGRTKEPGDKTFGIAIFEAADEAAARKLDRHVVRSTGLGRDGPPGRPSSARSASAPYHFGGASYFSFVRICARRTAFIDRSQKSSGACPRSARRGA